MSLQQGGKIGVLGAGSWGTALAITAARAGRAVALWDRDPQRVAALGATRENQRYLPGIPLDPAITPTAEIAEAAAAPVILLAVPAQTVREVVARLPERTGTLVLCAKGIEQRTGLRLSEVIAELRPQDAAAALSGPSFAREAALGLPTAVTVAAQERAQAVFLCEALASPSFRPYPSDDLLGVELGGALKNVVAVAAGAVMGKGLGENARAAVITRGLAETCRLAEALGARRETLMGLSGLGDLMLTATSLTSRNTSFGHALGQGRSVGELMAQGQALAEGAWTASAACLLAARHGVELPIADAVRRVVAGETDLDTVVGELMARPLAGSE
ncbi:NAD(P)H-dependent glycerol-3-phosphate dehydrogenase [Geminicoccaceae bacterium 1502E]|nr:NAD(P)H-dependent glycerol-3-phosphate dehydrogenase [Geminicoccaceae bacterium 1502E]